jgi:hypothetical protein
LLAVAERQRLAFAKAAVKAALPSAKKRASSKRRQSDG